MTKKGLQSLSRGRFVTFEGIDGCGKDTQIKLLVEWLEHKGFQNIKVLESIDTTREKGAKLRELLKNQEAISELNKEDHTKLAQMFLEEMLSRKEEIEQYVKDGYIVISNRWYHSTIAYNKPSKGSDPKMIKEWEEKITPLIKQLPEPDLLVYLVISPEEAYARICGERDVNDIEVFENIDKLREVFDNYEKITSVMIPDKYRYIGTDRMKEKIHGDVKFAMRELLGWRRS